MNLLNMLKDTVGDSLSNQASGFLGESKEGTSKALGAIMPSLMGSLANKGSDKQGAGAILDAIKGGGFDGSMLNNLGGMFSGGSSTTNMLNSGSGILNMLMGNKVGGLISTISSFAGIKRSSSSSLLSMAAPLVMSMIGKQAMSKNMGVSGLMDMLKGQKEHAAAAMPSGFSADGVFDKMTGAAAGAATGAVGLGKDAVSGTMNAGKKVVGGTMDAGKKVVGGTMDAGKKVVGGTLDAGKNVVGGAANMAGDAAGAVTGGGWIKWLLGGVVLLALLSVLGFNTCVGDKVAETTGSVMDKAGDLAGAAVDGVGDAAGAVADGVGDAAGAVGDAAGAVVDGVGDAAGAVADGIGGAFGKVNEAGKKALDAVTFTAGSAGSQMMDYVKGGFKGDNKFTFRNLTFASGSANIGGASGEEVDRVAAIMQAYPDVKIVVEGYTDNTGNAMKNKELSKARAQAVKARLVTKGSIAANRISTEGFGDANPVGDNATKEGQKQNRRIEVRIVQ